jgi:hypothetical protein
MYSPWSQQSSHKTFNNIDETQGKDAVGGGGGEGGCLCGLGGYKEMSSILADQ